MDPVEAERQPSRRVTDRSLSRRAFFVGGASVASTALVPTVSAQNGDDTEPVVTDAVLPTTAPTLDRDDYTGLFVQVVRVEAEEEINIGIEDCEIVNSAEDIIAYEIRLIDRIEGDHLSAGTILYALQDNENIHDGKLFVVNSQEACSADFVSVTLEQIGASRIGTGLETDDGAEGDTGGDTGSATPGFGIGTAAVSLGAGIAVLLRRLRAS